MVHNLNTLLFTMTEIGTACYIAGSVLRCPAASDFTFSGQTVTLDAEILCPFESVAQSSFIEASQQGRCQCDSTLIDAAGKPLDIDCECFACSPGSNFGFAYMCTSLILSSCTSFNCLGQCNGEIDFLAVYVSSDPLSSPPETHLPTTTSPTTSPTSSPSSAPSLWPTGKPTTMPSSAPTTELTSLPVTPAPADVSDAARGFDRITLLPWLIVSACWMLSSS
jgi:hypothetical protein